MHLFLDIDGVLNGHNKTRNGVYCGINQSSMQVLNDIYRWCYKKDIVPRIVIISAWRYLVLKGAMTLSGFIYMLYTHGLDIILGNNIIDVLPEDTDILFDNRAKLILQYIKKNNIDNYLIIDDLDLGYTQFNMNFHKVDGTAGLTIEDKRAILARFP